MWESYNVNVREPVELDNEGDKGDDCDENPASVPDKEIG